MKYVSYEQAKQLDKLGFDEECDRVETEATPDSFVLNSVKIPFVAQAINWFRKQEIYGYIHSSVASNYPRQCTFTVYDKNFQSYSSPLVYSNYEDCEENLLEYLLNNSHQL